MRNDKRKEVKKKISFITDNRCQNAIVWIGAMRTYLILILLYLGTGLGAGYATWRIEQYLYGDILDLLTTLLFVLLSTSGTLIVVSGIFCSEYRLTEKIFRIIFPPVTFIVVFLALWWVVEQFFTI